VELRRCIANRSTTNTRCSNCSGRGGGSGGSSGRVSAGISSSKSSDTNFNATLNSNICLITRQHLYCHHRDSLSGG